MVGMSDTAWYRWWEGDCEVHIVPDVERRRHRPLECWCGPTLDLMRDGVLRVTHRLHIPASTTGRS